MRQVEFGLLPLLTWSFCYDPWIQNLKTNVWNYTLVYIHWPEHHWELLALCNWKTDDIRVHKLEHLQHSSELLILSGFVQIEEYCIKISPVIKNKFRMKDVWETYIFMMMSGKPFLWEQQKHFVLFILSTAMMTWFLCIHLWSLLQVGKNY